MVSKLIKKKHNFFSVSETELYSLLFFFCLSLTTGIILHYTINFDFLKTILIFTTALYFYFLSGYLAIRKLNIDKEDLFVFSIIISLFFITISAIFNAFILKLKPNLSTWALTILFFSYITSLIIYKVKLYNFKDTIQQPVYTSSEKKAFNEKRLYLILLSLIFLFHVINNTIIIYEDNTYPVGDDLLLYAEQIRFFSDSPGALKTSFGPLLFSVSGNPLYPILGLSEFTFVFVNSLFLLILLFSIYKIGCFIHSRPLGILSAFIVSFSPYIFAMSRISFYEFGLLPSIFLTLYTLLRTDYFKSKTYSILFGISLALSAGVKHSFALYLLWPILLHLIFTIKSIKNSHYPHKKSMIKNTVLAFSSSIILICTIYLPNISNIFHRAITATTIKMSGTDYWYYPRILFSDQLSQFFLFFFIISCCYLIFTNRKLIYVFMICVVPPLLTLVLLLKNNLTPRYSMHLLPYFAFITATGLLTLRNKIIKHVLIFFLIIGLLFQFFLICYFPCVDNIQLFKVFKIGSLDKKGVCQNDLCEIISRYNRGLYSPSKYDCEFSTVKKILQPYIHSEHNQIYLQYGGLEHYIRSLFIFGNLSQYISVIRSPETKPSDFDFIFSSDGNISNIFANTLHHDSNLDLMFRVIGDFPIICGDETINVYIYKKNMATSDIVINTGSA